MRWHRQEDRLALDIPLPQTANTSAAAKAICNVMIAPLPSRQRGVANCHDGRGAVRLPIKLK
jgi:hypothetical protein